MSRYKLGITYKKDGRVIAIEKIANLEKLINIDSFTCNFNNENELKTYLFNKGLITFAELNHNITIMYKYNGKIKYIPVFYKNMKKYLESDYLYHKIKNLSDDIEFLEKLSNYYGGGSPKFNKQYVNISDIRIYLSDVRRKGEGDIRLLEVAISDLFEKEIFKERNNETGENKEDYRGLRNLALFIYRFKEISDKKQRIESQHPQQVINDIYVQTTLFDQVEQYEEPKWILSNEGDPDFPPNSEEEAMYLKYLDGLETPISLDIEDRRNKRK